MEAIGDQCADERWTRMAIMRKHLLQCINRFRWYAGVDPRDIDIRKPNCHPAGPLAAVVSDLLLEALLAAHQYKSRPCVRPTQRTVGPHAGFADITSE